MVSRGSSRSLESAAVVDERKPRRRTTSIGPAAGRTASATRPSLRSALTQLPPGNRQRPRIPVFKKTQEATQQSNVTFIVAGQHRLYAVNSQTVHLWTSCKGPHGAAENAFYSSAAVIG